MRRIHFALVECASAFLVLACGGGGSGSQASSSGGRDLVAGSGGRLAVSASGGSSDEVGGNPAELGSGGAGGTGGGVDAAVAGDTGIGGTPGAGGGAAGGLGAASGGTAGGAVPGGGGAVGDGEGGEGGGAGKSAGGESASGGLSEAGAGAGGAAGAQATGVPVAFVAQPTFTGNENPSAPQAGVLRLETDVPAAVRVTVAGGGEEWTLELPTGTSFEKPIVGLKPETTYSVSVSVSAGDNILAVGPLEWTSPPLPVDFIPIEVALSEPTEMEPGMTMFAVDDDPGAEHHRRS